MEIEDGVGEDDATMMPLMMTGSMRVTLMTRLKMVTMIM
jgi:hypothetical protein